MHIVVDTNVLIANPPLTSEKFRILVEYARRTESPIFVSDIALLELEGAMRRQLESHVARLNSITRSIESLTGTAPKVTELPDPEAAARLYVESVRKQCGLTDARILKSKPEHMNALVQRAVGRVRPFNEHGQEFRDALMWLQILDIGASDKKPDSIAFISSNTRDFGLNDSLHPTLRTEAEERNLNLQYFPSLDEFLKAHAERIAFITPDFVETALPAEDIRDAVQHDRSLERRLERWVSWRHDGLTYFKLIQVIWVELDDYYVYPAPGGGWTVIAVYLGEVEVEGEVETWDRRGDYYGYENGPTTQSLAKSVEVTVQVELSISAEKLLTDWQIIESDLR